MGEFPNKETQFKSGLKQVEIAKKGGLVRSEAKSRGQKIRWLKKMLKMGKLDVVNAPWVLEKLESDKAFALELMIQYENIKNDPKISEEKKLS